MAVPELVKVLPLFPPLASAVEAVGGDGLEEKEEEEEEDDAEKLLDATPPSPPPPPPPLEALPAAGNVVPSEDDVRNVSDTITTVPASEQLTTNSPLSSILIQRIRCPLCASARMRPNSCPLP